MREAEALTVTPSVTRSNEANNCYLRRLAVTLSLSAGELWARLELDCTLPVWPMTGRHSSRQTETELCCTILSSPLPPLDLLQTTRNQQERTPSIDLKNLVFISNLSNLPSFP